MRHAVVSLALIATVCASMPGEPAWAAKSKTPVTASVKALEMSPQELRIRVRALIRPTLGIVEEAADRSLRETKDPVVRRGIIVWKIETTTTLLSAMLRSDPLLALADAWGYAFQESNLLARPENSAKFGTFAADAGAAMTQVHAKFKSFTASLQAGSFGEEFEKRVRQWAEKNPIEGALYRRPSMDSAVAAVIANATGGGAFAALGSLEETTADVMTRLDLYTMYLPRLARWEAELAVDDLARGVDPERLAAELERFTRASDRIATVSEAAPDLIAREMAAALEALHAERIAAMRDLSGERKAVVDAVRQERIESLQEVEAIAQRLLDRSSGPLQAAVRVELEAFVRDVEAMRLRLILDIEKSLDNVVDHAFLRAVELLLIAAALVAVGVVLSGRFLRR